LSSDKLNLVSCGEDGSIYVSSIKEMMNGFDVNMNVTLLGGGNSSSI
jgi:hypothetical protein